MQKYVVSDMNRKGIDVFTHDDLKTVEDTMYALRVNDNAQGRDVHYCIWDSETGEVLHWEKKRVDTRGQWQMEWYMTPEVAEVLNWNGALELRKPEAA